MADILDLQRLKPGFSDPVQQSQRVFRALMDATARPGRIQTLTNVPTPPEPLSLAAGAVLLTLADNETPVWLEPALRGGAADTWLRFHCGCPLTQEPAKAAFALLTGAPDAVSLTAFNQGDAKYPDRATTVVMDLPSLTGGQSLVLRGPGILESITVAPRGLSSRFWEDRATCVSHFQFGVDLVLCSGTDILALPRTTRISLMEA